MMTGTRDIVSGRPRHAGGVDTRRLIKAGCLLIFLPLFVVGVLRWGGTSLDKAMVIGCGVLFVPAMACVCSLLLSTERLAYQGTLRILWLDVVWLGVVVELAACWLAPGLGKRARVGLFNAWFTGLLGIALLCVYDNLPAEHPLRARRIGTVPAEQDAKKTEGHLPWYARNKSIGANNYVWQHDAVCVNRRSWMEPAGYLSWEAVSRGDPVRPIHSAHGMPFWNAGCGMRMVARLRCLMRESMGQASPWFEISTCRWYAGANRMSSYSMWD